MGSDLMNQINKGNLTYRSSTYAENTKRNVTEAMTEILTFGGRIRPLMLDGERVGWLRPMGFTEKKQLELWFPDTSEHIKQALLHTTTLDSATIESFDMVELNYVLRTLLSANLADLSLFPFISSFVTTQASVNLWSSRYDNLFQPKTIRMPDGLELRQLAVSDHVRLWAALATIRDAAIVKLENALNSGIIAKAFSGDSSTAYIDSITKALSYYSADNMQPWMDTIDFVSYNSSKKELEDGFGHSHEDASTEGLMRELNGMIHGDKHEELMNKFYDKQIAEELARKKKLDELVQQRRHQLNTEEGDSAMVVRTEGEVRQREREIKEQTYGWVDRENKDMFNQDHDENMTDSETFERINKYL